MNQQHTGLAPAGTNPGWLWFDSLPTTRFQSLDCSRNLRTYGVGAMQEPY